MGGIPLKSLAGALQVFGGPPDPGLVGLPAGEEIYRQFGIKGVHFRFLSIDLDFKRHIFKPLKQQGRMHAPLRYQVSIPAADPCPFKQTANSFWLGSICDQAC